MVQYCLSKEFRPKGVVWSGSALLPFSQKFIDISRLKIKNDFIAPDKVLFWTKQVLIIFLFLHENMCCGYTLDDDELRFNDASTCECHLHQNGILIRFGIEMAIMVTFISHEVHIKSASLRDF